MPHSVAVTGMKTGPDRTVTQTFPNVTGINFMLDKKVLSFTTDPASGANVHELDIATAATITVTITSGNYVVAIA